MADRVSTIRFKVEGTSEVNSKIEELNRAIARQQRQLAQSTREAAQKQAGGTADAGEFIKRAKQDSDQLARLHRMRDKEREDQLRRELDNSRKGMTDLQTAEDRMYVAQEMKKIRAVNAENKLRERERSRSEATIAGIQREADVRYAASRKVKGGSGGSGGADGDKGSMRGFGAGMIIGGATGQAVANATGSTDAGAVMGVATSAAIFGGPAVLAAVVALEGFGAVMKANRDKAVESGRANREYLSTVNEIASAWTNFSSGQTQRSSFGEMLQQQKLHAEKAKLAASAALQEMQPLGGIRYNLWEKMTGQLAVKEIQRKGLEDTYAQQSAAQQNATWQEQAEYERSVRAQKEILGAKQKIYALDSMMPGFLKSQAQLTEQINYENVERAKQHEGEKQAADAAFAMATVAEQQARSKFFSMPLEQQKLARPEFEKAQRQLEEATKNRNRLPEQQARQNAEATADQQHRQEELQRQHDAEVEKQAYRTNEATVRAATVGYAQQLAVQQAAYDRELVLAARQGADILRLKQEEIAKLKEEERKRARREMEGELAAYDPAAAKAVNDRKMADRRAMGLSQEQAEKLETGEYYKQAAQSQIDTALAKREITMQEAEIQRGMLNDQRAAGNERVATAIKAAAAAKEESIYAEQVWRYSQMGKQTDIEIALQKREISVRDAEEQRMILADRRAQENTEHGAALRKQIAERADQQQRLRDTEATMKTRRQDLDSAYAMRAISYKEYRMRALKLDNPGVSDNVIESMYESQRRADLSGHWQQMQAQQFGTQYTPGRVNFAALNAGYQSKNQMDLTKDGNEWLRQIFMAITSRPGGFN